MAPDPTPFDPETKPPLFEDSLEVSTPNNNAFPTETTASATEIAVENGIDVGADNVADLESPIDPDDRTDLEGPDVLPDSDGTLTHPSFGAGVRLNLGMGTGAGEDETPDEPLVDLDPDDGDTDEIDDTEKGLNYVPDANGN